MKLADSNEDNIINRVCDTLTSAPSVLVGPGDDCAVVKYNEESVELLKTDCVIESVHFHSAENPKRVGWKAVARVISDIAAMGGTPKHLLVTLMLRKDTELSWLDELYAGMQECASAFSATIVGGETSSLPMGSMNAISIAGTGIAKRQQYVLRSTAKVGDMIFVTGSLGGSIKGHHLDFTPRLKEAQQLVNHHQISSMMDLSDGLAKDLPRLCQLSKVGYKIDKNALPCNPNCSTDHALNDGEDYELLFTVPAEHCAELIKNWPSTLAKTTCIGEICEVNESHHTSLKGGWDHFS